MCYVALQIQTSRASFRSISNSEWTDKAGRPFLLLGKIEAGELWKEQGSGLCGGRDSQWCELR